MPRIVLMCGQQTREVFEVANGTSLHNVMKRRNPETGNWPVPTICIFGGQPVLREDWKRILLRGDDVAVFAELPMGGGGGGSNPMQIVFMAAVIVASILVPYSAPFTTGALAGYGAAAGAAIAIAGSIASSLIFANRPSGQLGAFDAAQASPTYGINGSSNQARLYEPVPKGFGRMRIVPDLVAKKWAQYIGNEMYLYQAFGCGRETYLQEELAFGGVTFWRDGKIIESAYTSESGDQYVNKINAQLVAVADGGGWYGPYSATGDISLTLNATVDFPDGLCTYIFTGVDPETGQPLWSPGSATASLTAEYREKGSTDWLPLASQKVTKATTQAFSLLLSGKAEEYGEYEIRVRNTSVIPDTVSYYDPDTSQTYTTNTRKKAVLNNASSTGPSINVQIVEPGGTVTLFPDNVETSPNVASQELLAPNAEGHDWIGPFVTNAPGTKTDNLLFNFVFPQGLGRYDDKGRLKSYSVSLEIQYREVDDNDNPLSDWSTLRAVTYTAGTLTAQRKTESCTVAAGRYQARVRRTSNKRTDNKAVETIQWEAMTAMIPGSLTYGQTVIAVKIKATNVLSQNAADNFTVMQTAKLPLYDRVTKTWSAPQPTRSFAAAVSYVCKDKYGGGLVDRQIDLDTLWRIDEELEAKNWHYDAWIDGPYKVWGLLIEMCTAMRVVPRPGPVLSFIVDKSGRPVRHVFTPRDIVRGSFVPTWNTFKENTPDDVLVSYLDEELNYQRQDVRAKLPESESRKTASQNFLGITNRDHAHKIGLFMAACNRWRRLGCEFETEGVGRTLNLGDVISITHPRFRGTASGTLIAWDEATLTLRLSSSATVDGGIVPYMSLTRPDGTPWGPVKLLWVDGTRVRFDPEDYTALILQGFESPFSWLTAGEDRMPTVWTFQQGREFAERYIITGIIAQTLYRYRITCINDSDMVDSYDGMPTPPRGYRGNLPDLNTLPEPPNLQASLTDTEVEMLLSASWSEVAGATGYEVQSSTDGIDWVRYGQVNAPSVQFPVSDDTTWVRVATVRGYDQSSWSVWQGGEAA